MSMVHLLLIQIFNTHASYVDLLTIASQLGGMMHACVGMTGAYSHAYAHMRRMHIIVYG